MSKVSAVLQFTSGETVEELTVFQVPRIGERMSYLHYPGDEDPIRGTVTDIEWISSPLGALSQSVHIYIDDSSPEGT